MCVCVCASTAVRPHQRFIYLGVFCGACGLTVEIAQNGCEVNVDGSEGQIEFVENHGWLSVHMVFYIDCHMISRGGVILRDGFADSDHMIAVADNSTIQLNPGFRNHDNVARGGTAGIVVFRVVTGVIDGAVFEDNFVLGEETDYGHGHGGGALWLPDGPSLVLRNSVLRRNSVTLSLGKEKPYPHTHAPPLNTLTSVC